MFSKLTFIPVGISCPQNITACHSLHCDLWSITRHYRISIGDKFEQIFPSFSRHNKFLVFFNLVEVTLNGLSNFSSDSFRFLRKFSHVCPLLAKTVCKTLLTSHSGWTLDSDHVRRSHHSMTSIVRLYSNHKLRSTNHNASFILFIV